MQEVNTVPKLVVLACLALAAVGPIPDSQFLIRKLV